MNHTIQTEPKLTITYEWLSPEKNSINVIAKKELEKILPGSEAEFITEHYWGYTKLRNGTAEYEVTHPRWEIYPISMTKTEVNFAKVYGNEFNFLNSMVPQSIFLAEGSEISVKKGKLIRN